MTYQFTVGVVRSDCKFIAAKTNTGTTWNPFARSQICANANPTTYHITYDARIGDLGTPNESTSVLTLPCYLPGPP